MTDIAAYIFEYGGKNSMVPVLNSFAKKGTNIDFYFHDARVKEKLPSGDGVQYHHKDEVFDFSNLEAKLLITDDMRQVPSSFDGKVMIIANYIMNIPKSAEIQKKPDYIIVVDERIKQYWLDAGYDEGILLPLGNPYYQKVAAAKSLESREKILERMGLDPNKQTIFYASRPISTDNGNTLGYDEKSLFTEFINGVKLLPEQDKNNLQIVFKPHEREKTEWMQKEIAKIDGVDIKFCTDYRPHEYAAIAAVCVSSTSNYLVEMSAYDVPSISLQPNMQGEDLLWTNSMGITKLTTSAEEFSEALLKILNKEPGYEELFPNREKFMREHSQKDPIKDISALIEEIISE